MLSRHPSGTQITLTDTSSANTNITAATQTPHRHLLCKRRYNCGDTDLSHRHLTDLSHRHLLCKRQYNCGDTDHSHRHLLCKRQYNCGDTDHSHRHLLCKHQYNCGNTDLSHRHLLCKHQYNYGDTDHSHRHLLCRHQYNCGDTDHSLRHLLCKHQYNCGDTDHSLRHLLCFHQYNCGDTDHCHRHLLCKHQYNCGATDHSHRHLLCKHQYNCGARTQLDTLSGPLQTRSPLWRALRRHRKRLRTLADGCERLRPKTQNLANTASPPDPQVKREPSLRIREKYQSNAFYSRFTCWFSMAFFSQTPMAIGSPTSISDGLESRPAGAIVLTSINRR